LSHPQERLVEDLKIKDPELFAWLEEAVAKNIPVAYINMGSVTKLQKWSLDAITDGLKQLGCRIVWALKDEYADLATVDPRTVENFWCKAWIHQIETIAHPAIRVGMTHCGSGATQEFIGAGIPIVAFPHFGDQHYYGDLLVEMKAGIILYNKRRDFEEGPVQMTYEAPAFEGKRVLEAFRTVIDNPMYKTNMLKLQRLSQRLDGRKRLAQAVQTAYEDGNSHLIDHELAHYWTKKNCCVECMCSCLALGLIAAFIYFLVFFIQYQDIVKQYGDL
jgi:UDP:flavonoid glycosyltransferase YjiC (YdhE family)